MFCWLLLGSFCWVLLGKVKGCTIQLILKGKFDMQWSPRYTGPTVVLHFLIAS